VLKATFTKSRILGAILPCAAVLLIGAGCQQKASETPTASSNDLTVTPVSTPAPAATPAYAPAPMASTAQPVVYDTTPGATGSTAGGAGGPGSPVSGSTYVVKHGDTLYGIARKAYGDGKQWQRIADANPGLSPQALKVGQTINVP
jgi:nucleoid-associated protein YgaU